MNLPFVWPEREREEVRGYGNIKEIGKFLLRVIWVDDFPQKMWGKKKEFKIC